MSLKEFANFGYEVSDEDYYDLSGYEEVTLDELNEGDEITGKPVARLYLADEDYKADNMQFFILSEAKNDNGELFPIKVKFNCNIPQPTAWSPDNYPLCTVYKNNGFLRNTYWAIYSILKLQGYKNIDDKDGNPVNSFKNVSAKAYLDILADQKEITIKVKDAEAEYPTFDIISIK